MRFVLAMAAVIAWAFPAWAGADRIQELYDLMHVRTAVEIMAEEGMFYALDSEEVLFDGPAAGDWGAALTAVYDPDRLEGIVRAGFEQGLAGADLTPLIAFFDTPTGQKVVALELSARRAFLARDVEQMARETWRQNPTGLAHSAAISRYIEVNDLIERNVTGSMNANMRFLRAFNAGNTDLSESDILSDIWAEEDRMRADTVEWMNAFLSMAYAPLEADEMQANLELWQSQAGQALNNALFLGFDRMFEQVSEELGMVAAGILTQQEL